MATGNVDHAEATTEDEEVEIIIGGIGNVGRVLVKNISSQIARLDVVKLVARLGTTTVVPIALIIAVD